MADRHDRSRATPEESGSDAPDPDVPGKDLLPEMAIEADRGVALPARSNDPEEDDGPPSSDRSVDRADPDAPDGHEDPDDPDARKDADDPDDPVGPVDADADLEPSDRSDHGASGGARRQERRQLRQQQRRRRRRLARARRARPRRRRHVGHRTIAGPPAVRDDPSETTEGALDRDPEGRDELDGSDDRGTDASDASHDADQIRASDRPDAPDGLHESDAPDGLHESDAPDQLHEPDAPDQLEELAGSGVLDGADDADGPDGGADRPAGSMDDFFLAKPAPPPSFVDRLGRGGVVLLALTVVVALAALAVGLGWIDRARDLVLPPEAGEELDPPPGGWQPALLLLTTVSTEGSADDLRAATVLASDRRTGQATVLLIPTATVTDVPGFGSFTLAEAWDFGGSSLVAVTIDNLLGLRIDGVLAADTAAWEDWFGAFGGATIDVGSRVVAAIGPAAGSTRFEPGEQHLEPNRVAEYLVIQDEDETELQGLPRVQQVVRALSQAVAEDPAGLDHVVEVARTLPGTATPTRIETVLGELAEARAADAATTITLPVVPLGSGEDEVYRPDQERLEALMADRFAASRELGAAGQRLAVQILNGNARPGVGQEVADALADGRYRIVLTGNADRFTYEETRILVYTDERSDLEAAQDVRERLGVGIIERSGTPQSVVDLTIIVGADFPPE